MTNKDIAQILREIALFLEMDDVPFKPQAYEKAAETIEASGKEVAELYKDGGVKSFYDLPGVGKAIAEKLEELVTTGKLKYYNDLKKKYPIDITGLMGVEGIGPKTIKHLYQKLKIKNLEQLAEAARKGKIKRIPGFGKKTEEKILDSIGFYQESHGRLLIHLILPRVEEILTYLRSHPVFERVEVGGSIRRMKETIGDVDLVATAHNADKAMEIFTRMPGVLAILATGPKKSNIRMYGGLEVDLRIVEKKSFGSALLYFSGSKEHNVLLRTRALGKGYTLNEYGLFTNDKKKKFIAGKTEHEVYEALGLNYIPPELREDSDVIPYAEKKKITGLVGYGDLRGDMQVQTTWTDGTASIEEMAVAAYKAGLEYIVITDHTKTLAFTNGSTEEDLIAQMKEIDRVNKKLKGKPFVLKGAEVNILKDGTLDIRDDVLEKLDVVGAAVHTNMKMTKEEMTDRICKAMHNPHVDVLFHPTGRIVGRRDEYSVDIDCILETAAQTGTVLEINASSRLDLRDVYIKKATHLHGIKFAIDSDAHHPRHFGFLPFGVGQARRGWVKKRDVINTYPKKEMLALLKDGQKKKRRKI